MLDKLTLLLFLLINTSLFAKTESGVQLWEDNFHTVSLNDKISLTNRFGFRFYNYEQPVGRLEYRPHVNFLWQEKFKVKAGLGLFYYKTNSKYNAMEYRPWMGFGFNNKLGSKATLSHNLRWENRWYSEYAPFESRLRYQLQLGTKVYTKGEKEVKIALAPEFFYSAGSFDNFAYKSTRIAIATSYTHSSKLSFEAAPMVLSNFNQDIAYFEDRFWAVQVKVKYKVPRRL